jgi:hypothetical protein
MNAQILVLFVSLLGFGSAVLADISSYQITIDTSSLLGSGDGSLDFQFNPGALDTQGASVEIVNFTSDGALVGSPVLTGNVAGGLPGTITFDNGSFYNDYFQVFTYGSTISFQLNFFGPALDTPDGISSAGSLFTFGMFSDTDGLIPVLTNNPDGSGAFTVDVNLDGTTTVTNFSDVTTVAAVPTPSTVWLLSSALLGWGVFGKRRRYSEQV